MKTGKKQKMDNRAKVQVSFCSHFSFSGHRTCLFSVPRYKNILHYLILFSPSSVILSVHTTFAQYIDDEYW